MFELSSAGGWAHALRPAYAMRIRIALMLGTMVTAGCGQVNFGVDLLPGDAAVVVDSGPDVVDTGLPQVAPDTGAPPPDADCRPVTLPPADLPAQYPFQPDDQATFQAIFLDWGREQNCTACHSFDRNLGPPLIIDVDENSMWEQSRTQVWDVVATSEPKASDRPLRGRLWRHAEGHEDRETSTFYSPQQISFLENLIFEAWSCQVPAYLAPQDAGPSCGEPPPPPDTGITPQDAGLIDGGPADATPADAPPPVTSVPCFCDDQPDAGVSNRQYCPQP